MIPTPRENPLLFGHDAARRAFARALARGRLHHAWLLHGPRGLGKSTLAWHLLRLWLSGGEEDAATDPRHPLFRATAAGSFPDLSVLEPDAAARSREIPVDAVRRTAAALHGTALGARRAVLVDAADDLNRNAANALLKLLEEPPAGVLFVLVCHRPGAIPPTVLSRTRRVALGPVPGEEVERLLALFRPDLDPERRRRLAALAEGRPGRALALADGEMEARYAAILRQLASGGPVPPELVETLAATVRTEGWEAVLDPLGLALRRMVRAAAGAPPAAGIVEGEEELLRAAAARLSLEDAASLWERLAAFAGRAERLHLDPAAALLTLFDALRGPERLAARLLQ